MILLYETLNAFANLLSNIGFWLILSVLTLIGFSVFLMRSNMSPKQPRPWLVRKGACPFCDSELFGTTREYQRLNLLETLAPESKYLCITCDREKVSGLLSKLG